MKEETDNEWIHIKDKTPPDYMTDVLCYLTRYGKLDDDYGYCVIACYTGSKWIDDILKDIEDNPNDYEVTHWMYLPEPPISLKRLRQLKIKKLCSKQKS